MDTRRDAGEFYPGGKVISTRPLASGGDVKHSDFEDLDVKTNTIPDLREAVRELGRRLGATVVTALVACVAIAATVQTVPVNDLDFDANPSMVTNVTFEGLAQEGELESIRDAIESNRFDIASNADSISTLNDSISTVSNAAVYAAITNALQDAAISTLNNTKLDKSGGTVNGDMTVTGEFAANDITSHNVAGLYGGVALGPDQTIMGNGSAGDKIIFVTSNGSSIKQSSLTADGSDVMTSNRVAAAISTLSDSISTLNDTKASKADATLTPIYSQPPTFTDWTFSDVSDGVADIQQPVFIPPTEGEPRWKDSFGYDGQTLTVEAFVTDEYATNLAFTYSDEGLDLHLTATRTRTNILGYQLGSQSDKPLASEAEAEALRTAVAGKQDNLPYPTNAIPYAAISGKPNLATVATSGSYNDLSSKPTIPTVPTAQINAATTTNALQDTAIGDLSNDNAQTRQIVTTWENFLDGSNVVFSITNYLSGSYNLDAAKLRILELREGEYHEVFNSRDEILLHIENFRTNDFRAATNQLVGAVNEAIGGKADRDWGKYTSAGGDAPANTVYMTAPNTVFAGGLEYERVAVGEGTICVLTTRGAPTWTQGDEGTFKFQDDGGTNYFGFAKTDSYTIGANTDGITVQGGMVTMNYNITMSGRPCVWYKSSLSSGAWEQLNLPDGSPVAGASHAVTWEANPDPGTQVCYINVGNAPSGFFRATVEATGEAKFMTNMPAEMSGGIVCPNTATGVSGVIKPTFNGTSVIWTWSAK